jgi:hypothetical protein
MQNANSNANSANSNHEEPMEGGRRRRRGTRRAGKGRRGTRKMMYGGQNNMMKPNMPMGMNKQMGGQNNMMKPAMPPTASMPPMGMNKQMGGQNNMMKPNMPPTASMPPMGMNKQMGGARRAVGTHAEVWHGTADHTSGGLKKKDLMKNKHGRIISKKKHALGKKALKNLVKAGYKAKKGTFKLFRK